MQDDSLSREARDAFAAFDAMRRARRERPAIRAAGFEALRRLVKVAQGHSGQSRHVAGFLLSLYNGDRFKFDLTDLRALDRPIFDDCMAVLQMDYMPEKEVHCYFEDGRQLWEQMAKEWNIKEYSRPPQDGMVISNDIRTKGMPVPENRSNPEAIKAVLKLLLVHGFALVYYGGDVLRHRGDAMTAGRSWRDDLVRAVESITGDAGENALLLARAIEECLFDLNKTGSAGIAVAKAISDATCKAF